MKADLKKLLQQSSEAQLRELIESIYGINEQVDKQVAALLLVNDAPALFSHLKKQIQSLKRGIRFITYGESLGFSRELDRLIEQIHSVLPQDPKATFELIDLLMNAHEKIYERCDDSGGSVGESFSVGRELWLEAAAAWQASEQLCQLDWSAEIRKRHNENDYAVWDNLVGSSWPLLGDEKLRGLGALFEADVVREMKQNGDEYNYTVIRSQLGMSGVAAALGDVAMYEHAFLLCSPEPNGLQKERIARFCLQHGAADSALKWLAGDWHPRFADRQQVLKDLAYQMAGREADLLALRRQAYLDRPGFDQMQKLLEVVPENEQAVLRAEAKDRARAAEDIIVAVDTLMQLHAIDEAGAYVLEHPDQLDRVSYSGLVEWAEDFIDSGEILAAVLLYRRLMLDILQAGRSKAYRHAAKYYKTLEHLDGALTGYQPLISKAEFDSELRATHGRKRSFWSLVK